MNLKSCDIKLEGLDPSQICFGCFSVNRKLSPLEDIAEVFHSLLDKRNVSATLEQGNICWECKCSLKKVMYIKRNVNLVQDFLQTYYCTFKTASPPPSLSKLKKSPVNHDFIAINHDELQLEINLQPKDLKAEINTTIEVSSMDIEDIKTEIEDWGYEDPTLIDHSEPINTDKSITETNLSAEPVTEAIPDKPINDTNSDKQRARRKKNKFEVIKCNENKKENLMKLYRKISINDKELQHWLEEEKKNKFYLKWRYKCEFCIMGFSSEEQLDRHVKKLHLENNNEFICDVCTARLSTRNALASHMSHHYYMCECDICGDKCWSSSNMLSHIKTCHAKSFKCRNCGLCFESSKLFYQHYKEMHDKYICDTCGKICSSRKVIKHHLAKRHGNTDCKICSKTFKSRAVMRAHMQHKHSTSNPELAYCVECDKQLANVHAFKRHLEYSKAHAKDNLAYNRYKSNKVPCPECEKVYVRRAYMMNHYRHVHLKQSKFYCQDCDKYYLNRTRYLHHRKSQHEGLKPEKNKLCTICGRGFSTNRILEKHIRTHTGERPFVCTFCDAKFTQKESMQSHVKHIHLKIKRQNTTQINKFF